VKTTGDGMLVEFVSVVDAVRCAVDVQRRMLERNAEVAPDRRIQFRVGINVGDIISDDNDIYGDGVNVAARLEALAEPGGICVSRVVHDQVCDKLDFSFEDMGARKAVAANDNDATAHTALAIFELFSGHHAEARRRLHRALELNPNSEVARGYLGVSYAFGGDYEA